VSPAGLGTLLAAAHPTIPDTIVFVLGSLIVLLGALGVVFSRNSVHAALSLVGTLFGVAILFIEQQADFLAVVQIIVYAGAIVVLFLFVIMFLGVDRHESVATEPLRGQRPMAIVFIAVALAGVIALGVEAHWVTGAHHVTYRTAGGYQDVRQIGKSVFTTYLYAFEATAALLVIAVVGAVILSRRPTREVGEADTPEATGTPVDLALGPEGPVSAEPPLAAAPAVAVARGPGGEDEDVPEEVAR